MGKPPSIAVIVPNFNGGATLEATLRSLIDQQYPSLEIIVVDGGSTDNSVEIIRKYQSHLTWWVSEKDRGQSHALNKGFARATGEIVNWLCSDDTLMPGALHTVASKFMQEPAIDVVVGACTFVYLLDPARTHVETVRRWRIDLLPVSNCIPQPSCFFRRRLLASRTPPLDEAFHYAMDFELWNYFLQQGVHWKCIDDVLSVCNFSSSNKTSTGKEKITYEIEEVYKRYIHERVPLTAWHRRLRYPMEKIRARRPGISWFSFVYYPYQCAMILLLAPFYGFQRVRWMNWVMFG